MSTMMNRSGIGYDVHPFESGRPLVLGGVEIPHSRGLKGHSDADVLCHAIADAVLGAIGERDIGHHFPNTDESLRGMSSLEILRGVRRVLLRAGATLSNVDSTVIAEEPKIGPHVSEMRMRIAEALGIAPRYVGIKATTNEGLGFVGRGEGIAALAVASVVDGGLDPRVGTATMLA
jgi:2-C-methyl-D-erythritol 2,4-cyclodiphosphate synthase